jgi:hypothetical protein
VPVIPWSLGGGIPYISLVSSSPGEDATSAAEAVLAAVPPDDAGAETADRYEWQAAMAAANGLALYFDAIQDGQLVGQENTRIVCEHHEDWVVVRADYAELVSAKHRETAYGVFSTIGQLLEDGGLAHLFERWHVMRELPGCRLVTTAGLAPGKAQELESAARALRTLRDAGQMLLIGGEHDKTVAQFAEALQKHARDKLPPSWQSAMEAGETTPTAAHRNQVGRFLSVLSIDHGKPSRAYVTHAAPTLYCAPVLRLLGKDAPLCRPGLGGSAVVVPRPNAGSRPHEARRAACAARMSAGRTAGGRPERQGDRRSHRDPRGHRHGGTERPREPARLPAGPSDSPRHAHRGEDGTRAVRGLAE